VVLENYQHENLQRESGRKIELDVFLPKERLAFEYQGEQHFQNIYCLANPHSVRERDEEKRLACKMAGITLIEVPYWWDFEKESLMASIHQRRPELLENPGNGVPIILQIREDYDSSFCGMKNMYIN
jgi:hypothetical protein